MVIYIIVQKILISQQLQYISIKNNKYINAAWEIIAFILGLICRWKYISLFIFIYLFINNFVRNLDFTAANCCKIVNDVFGYDTDGTEGTIPKFVSIY